MDTVSARHVNAVRGVFDFATLKSGRKDGLKVVMESSNTAYEYKVHSNQSPPAKGVRRTIGIPAENRGPNPNYFSYWNTMQRK